MTTWKPDDLSRVGDAEELSIAGRRRDGSLRRPVIVWAVQVGDTLYARSVNGPDASWFRGVQLLHRGQLTTGGAAIEVDFADAAGEADDQIDAAYQAKYGRYPGPVRSITSDVPRSTTVKITPPPRR
jgi:hypothetical protein